MSGEEEKNKVIEFVSLWGNSASDALLDPSCQLFWTPKGVIGFRIELGCAVVYGDPVCSPQDKQSVAQAFHHECQKQGVDVIYLVASEEFSKWALGNVCKVSIEFGETLLLDCSTDPREGKKGQLLRRTLRHAEQEGVSVHEYVPQDVGLEAQMNEVADAWLKKKQGPQAFLSHVHLFDRRTARRWFYAKQNEKIIGVLMLNQIQRGWLVNHLISGPGSPRGTSEMLIMIAFETLIQEKCPLLTLGVVPKQEPGKIIGLNKGIIWLFQKGYQIGMRIMHLKGRRRYWDKFHPETKSCFLLCNKRGLGINQARALMRAINT